MAYRKMGEPPANEKRPLQQQQRQQQHQPQQPQQQRQNQLQRQQQQKRQQQSQQQPQQQQLQPQQQQQPQQQPQQQSQRQQQQPQSKKVNRRQRQQNPVNLANPPINPTMATTAMTTTTTIVLQEPQGLEEMLRSRGCLPGDRPYEEQRRNDALITLETILCEWAFSVQAAKSKSSYDSTWRQPKVSLVTFGSYRLGVHRSDSDLDVLAMSPPDCSRGDFFTSLVDVLQKDARVTEVHAIPSAFTPVIKFRLNEIQIDMLFGRAASLTKLLDFQRNQTPQGTAAAPYDVDDEYRREYLIDDSDLVGADDAGVRSLNGARVTQIILKLVEPNPEAFRITLCAVKEWAIIHGVYSNILGFLGGINFAILVAWVCMRHPDHKPPSLLSIFFSTFARWSWPTPVALCEVQKEAPNGILAPMPVWDPHENPRDAKHLMPILTPAYPSMNSAYNVGVPQLRRIKEEMYRAAITLERGEEQWRDIFTNNDFFYRHSNFLQVTVRAPNSNFLPWQRFCESRLRLLIHALETPQVSAWPFARFFVERFSKIGKVCAPGQKTDDTCLKANHFFIALRFSPGVESINLRFFISEFLHKMNSWEERKEGMDLGICHLLRDDLPNFVFSHPKIPRPPGFKEAATRAESAAASAARAESAAAATRAESAAAAARAEAAASAARAEAAAAAARAEAAAAATRAESAAYAARAEAAAAATRAEEATSAARAQTASHEGTTKLSPAMGRSTLSDEDPVLPSPSKKARGYDSDYDHDYFTEV